MELKYNVERFEKEYAIYDDRFKELKRRYEYLISKIDVEKPYNEVRPYFEEATEVYNELLLLDSEFKKFMEYYANKACLEVLTTLLDSKNE